MHSERALKIVLVIVGLLFTATGYATVAFLREESALAMMMCVYCTLGVFLLIAAREPAANRSLISFAAWSSFVHAVVMTVQGFEIPAERVHFISGSVALVIIGVALLALSPTKQGARAAEEAA